VKEANHSKDHNDHHNHEQPSPICKLSAPISKQSIVEICPSLLLRIVDPSLCEVEHSHKEHELSGTVWMYAVISIVVISACGLLAVAVIPVMQKLFYQQMIQFLVALAVGTLCGDALLHLLPHVRTAKQTLNFIMLKI
jgi:solute carrier family 39 (zinc transporter), member 5